MAVDLPAVYVGLRTASAQASKQDGVIFLGVRAAPVEGCAMAALERERSLSLAHALKQLPSGACLMIRDESGREWYIRPADRAMAHRLGRAA